MERKYSVCLKRVAKEFGDLRVVYAAADYETRRITTADLNRPGLQLMGYYKYFDASRIQLMGKAESYLMAELDPKERLCVFDALMKTQIPALIVCHGQEILPECVDMAKKHGVSVFATDVDTSEFYAQLIGALRRHLAPRATIHGVLVEVHGEGMLITGDSGIGKSETALELIKRGHRFIADDAVEILRTSRVTLEGRAPEIIRYFMELRGIGVVDVQSIYGMGSVKPSAPIDLVVNLQTWEDVQRFDRLGIETQTTEILGVRIPIITIPVRPGRNLAVILELAAMNNRQKKSGYNAAEELSKRVDANVDAAGMNYQ